VTPLCAVPLPSPRRYPCGAACKTPLHAVRFTSLAPTIASSEVSPIEAISGQIARPPIRCPIFRTADESV
jgi:hypothetical protein